ncbi:MAG TPA: DUF4388 domain-containing protein [Thermoanaerobaculia bacterium]|nr:DUF4388 domain-containing protein [Thermoanaerobaculia bacterium]
MSLAGKLEDVPLADVMQFIHLGRRTGTLVLERSGEHAEVDFHHGAIVGARAPTTRPLGELLVEERLIDRDALEEALRAQRREPRQRSLGQILLASGAVAVEDVRGVVRSQIERTIYELVTWSRGSFAFAVDSSQPIDDVAVSPGELIPDIDLNTQMVLLEAARIFDQRNRSDDPEQAPQTAVAPRPAPPPPADRPAGLSRGADAEASPRGREAVGPGEHEELRLPLEVSETDDTVPVDVRVEKLPPLHLVGAGDPRLVAALRSELGRAGVEVETVAAPAAGLGDGDARPIVAFALAAGSRDLEELAAICRRHPGLPVICIVDDVGVTARAYAAGAAAVVPRDVAAVVGCFHNMARFRNTVRQPPVPATDTRSAFARLRRVVADLRSGVFSATVALNLMNVIAEEVERAVLFLVKQDGLTALGAFGFGPDDRPLAEATRGLTLPLERGGALAEAIDERRAIAMSFTAAALPERFSRLLGRPKREEVVIFPVLGSDRVILLIYTDNGALDRPIEEIDILDLATAEVGIAFENELLRRQLEKKG